MLTAKAECKHGTFTYFKHDQTIGHSLEKYGDYSEDEVEIFKQCIAKDRLVIDVGSNIGALTIPMARIATTVMAFEAQPEIFQALSQNLIDNNIRNVRMFNLALGARSGWARIPALDELENFDFATAAIGTKGQYETPIRTLDGMLERNQTRVGFIKIDVAGSELAVLQGAEHTINKWRPIIYVKNEIRDMSPALTGWLIDHDYRCYWHRSPLYIDQNYRGEKLNMFGETKVQNMLCGPEERGFEVAGMDEVDDQRVDDQMYVRERKRALKRLESNPGNLDARVIAAHFTNLMNNEKEALELLEQNLALKPDHAPSLAVKGLIQLQDGNYKDGWQAYELRYHQLNPAGFGWRPHDVPHWDGRPTDERILIWCEQGFGDSIMFGRFMKRVLELAPNAILEIQPQLYELFETSRIMPEGQLFRLGRQMPPYVMHCSLPSVPAILHFDSEDDLRCGKYMYADPAMVQSWRKRNTPRVGICTRGGVASERSYSRDMPFDIANNLARRYGPFMTLTHEGQWESYADTAAAIEALDLVLTVDTSVAHLAGALGARTILMLSSDPDFRWQRERSDTPWYPSMTIVRQKRFMDWSNVIDQVAAALEEYGKAAQEGKG